MRAVVLAGLVTLAVVSVAFTQPAAPRKNTLPDEARSEALAFAEEHHPELAGLLRQLRTRNEREFDRAARQIVSTAERLERLRDRDAERYEIQLETWKLDSRIKLLAARLSMGDDPALEKQLAELVATRIDVRVRQLKLDREQLEQRLQTTAATIDRLESDREKAIERELRRIHTSLETMPTRDRDRSKTVRTKAAD